MTPAAAAWAQFVVCGALIGVAGYRLSCEGERIGRLTGLTRSWVGLALLATVTSLPELAVTGSAWRLGALDMAIGHLLGSIDLLNTYVLYLHAD